MISKEKKQQLMNRFQAADLPEMKHAALQESGFAHHIRNRPLETQIVLHIWLSLYRSVAIQHAVKSNNAVTGIHDPLHAVFQPDASFPRQQMGNGVIMKSPDRAVLESIPQRRGVPYQLRSRAVTVEKPESVIMNPLRKFRNIGKFRD